MWKIKDLIKNYREASCATQELLAEQIIKRMPQQQNDSNKKKKPVQQNDSDEKKEPAQQNDSDEEKKLKGIINNIERERSLKDNALLYGVLKRFTFIDIESEIAVIEFAYEIARTLKRKETKLNISEILEYNSIHEFSSCIANYLTEDELNTMYREYLSEITIGIYEYKVPNDPSALMDSVHMNNTAKLIFYTVFFHLLMEYNYNNHEPYYGKDQTENKEFIRIANLFGYNWTKYNTKDIKDPKEKKKIDQTRSRALTSINKRVGLIQHLFDNKLMKDYFKQFEKNEEANDKTYNNLIKNNPQYHYYNDFINKTMSVQTTESLIAFTAELEIFILPIYLQRQGFCTIPGKEYFNDLERKIEQLNCESKIEQLKYPKDIINKEELEDINKHLKFTKEKIKDQLEKAKKHFNDNNGSFEDVKSWNLFYFHTKKLNNMIKHANLELIDTILLHLQIQANSISPQQ